MIDFKRPTAALIGRYQPPHQGHLWLVQEALQRVGQVVLLIREPTLDANNPFTFEEVAQRWRALLDEHDLADRVEVQRAPNLTHVFCGRDVGWQFEALEPPAEIAAISASKIRAASR